MSLVLAGTRIETPGHETRCPLDGPGIHWVTDGYRSSAKPLAVMIHTVHGVKGPLHPGTRASQRAEAYQRRQERDPAYVSWHLTLDTDRTTIEGADPGRWVAYHACHANGWSRGIELIQDPDGGLYEGQMTELVWLVTLLCDQFGIPKRVPVDASGKPLRGPVKAWRPRGKEKGLQQPWAGVLGHRHVTSNKGFGDPGDWPFLALLSAGFKGVTVTP